MDWTNFLETLLKAVLVAAAPVITAFLVKYLESLREKAKIATDNAAISYALGYVLEVVMNAVECTSQTYVEELKKIRAFDKEAQAEAFTRTKDVVMKLLSVETIELLALLYNDVDLWLDTQIEAIVNQLKKGVEQ